MQGEQEDHTGQGSLNGSGAMPLEAGDPRRIGAFRLLGVLGSGGMGRVYLGAVPGKFAAVKRVLPLLAEDADFLSHFGHELDNLARLPGGADTKLLASDRTAKPPWFATEFIPGITLSEAVRLHGGPLPTESLWRLLRDAAAGLKVVHGADMVHRDLKPSNIMLTGSGLSLIDFGVARAADQSRLTKTGMVIGTPAYMAPEQAVADRQLTGAADVFALGSLLLYAANGRPPFGDGSGPDLLYRVVHGEPDFGKLPETDPELAALVRTCFAKDPADRPTAAELVERADEKAAGAAWPAAVAERIGERAEFAAGAPTAEHLAELERAEPAQDVATASLTPQGGKEPATAAPDPVAVTGAAAPGAGRTRRNRFVMLAVPVVVATGTTLTVALGPYEIGRLGAAPDTSGSPSVVASQPAPGNPAPVPSSPSASAKPGASTSPSASASSGPSSAPPGGSTAAPPPGTGGAGGAGGGGTTPGDGSGSGSGSGSDSGSGSGSGSTTGPDGGGSTTTSPGGGGGGGTKTTQPPAPQPSRTTDRPAPPPATGGSTPSGTYSVESVSNGECLAESNPGYAILVNTVPCGTPPNSGTISYVWTYSAGANGTFRLINKATGHCLQPGGTPGFTATACNGSSLQTWKINTKTSAGMTIKNVNSGQCMVAGPPFMMSYSCDPSSATQLWRNVSPVG
ncbi:protein kinase [Streptomyces narbonensis]|uniref:non-specific serine/threonine protein kinase n=1 Tax=Streptomyces narbonensis TaxID=67333 RepID=A0ABV3CFJ1_9ACTN